MRLLSLLAPDSPVPRQWWQIDLQCCPQWQKASCKVCHSQDIPQCPDTAHSKLQFPISLLYVNEYLEDAAQGQGIRWAWGQRGHTCPQAEGAHEVVMSKEHFEQIIITIPIINTKNLNINHLLSLSHFRENLLQKIYLIEIFPLGVVHRASNTDHVCGHMCGFRGKVWGGWSVLPFSCLCCSHPGR